jgi:hypothetical protein
MSSAFTITGQTRINQLFGLEQPLVIDRMILALIPGLDPTEPVNRNQQMPAQEHIVHTHIIDDDHKGYVNPDQVVYSMILGSDVGDFSFNWIGIIEAVTNTVITVTTTPETPKRKTNLANNTTGNCITRNVMLAFQDAQALTGISIAADSWQFDFSAELTNHAVLRVNPESTDDETLKHLTDAQAKVWRDHVQNGFVHRGYRAGDEIMLPYVPTSQQMLDRRMLERNGASLLRVDFPDLFAALGTMYGAADSTHFNLPDDRGLFARIWSHASGVDPDAASRTNRGDGIGGDNVGSKQGDEFKSHAHSINTYSADVGAASGFYSDYVSGNLFLAYSNSNGGNETRPKNRYKWGGICY